MNFSKAIQALTDSGFNPYPPAPRIQIPNAREALMEGLRHYVGDKAQWSPAYDKIAAWLTDNKGRGLLCYGGCGLGKTLICCNILPVLLHHYCRKIVTVYDAISINDKLAQAKHDPLLVIDDIGTEGECVRYGERHIAFAEICDEAEKRGHLLIITTNLSTTTPAGADINYPSIENRYGIRTLDRLRALTTVVHFDGKSLRK